MRTDSCQKYYEIQNMQKDRKASQKKKRIKKEQGEMKLSKNV